MRFLLAVVMLLACAACEDERHGAVEFNTSNTNISVQAIEWGYVGGNQYQIIEDRDGNRYLLVGSGSGYGLCQMPMRK